MKGGEKMARGSCRQNAMQTSGRSSYDVLMFYSNLQMKVRFNLPLKDMFILNRAEFTDRLNSTISADKRL